MKANGWLLGTFAPSGASPYTQYEPRPGVSQPVTRTSPKRTAKWLERPYIEATSTALALVGGSVASVGSMLAQGRMSAGMSIEDLAYKSKLRATIISAIEADDFSLCGGEVYARGQIRALARLIGLDPESVIEVYESQSRP